MRAEFAIIGSGFAGSLLARILASQGRDVVLLERGSHPRFALGESSTPLANLSLERIAQRYGFADLHALATYGRWLAAFPNLRRGLKRGFSFYQHREGVAWSNDAANSARLLVAASPEDAIADTHWLREDVDQHFVAAAQAAGADYRDAVRLDQAEASGVGLALRGTRDGQPFELRADFVIDASGPAGFLAGALSIPSALDRTLTRSALLFGHFRGVRPLSELAASGGIPLTGAPYPEERAAVHHLFAGGWAYSLRFDHGVVSAGFLLSPSYPHHTDLTSAAGDPAAAFHAVASRYPGIAASFADAEPLFPVGWVPKVQYRRRSAWGTGWLLLPHSFAFVDPLFSTGIAWSLLGVERIAELLLDSRGTPSPERLAGYGTLLGREADQLDLLVAGAYRCLGRLPLFAAHSMLYFAAVSWSETRQRLGLAGDPAWEGMLGIDDPLLAPLFPASYRRLAAVRETATEGEQEYADWVAGAIRRRNLAGLADPARSNCYPADPAVLVERAELLGLSREAMRATLARGSAGARRYSA